MLNVAGVPCIENGDVYLDENYPDAVIHLYRNVGVMIGLVVGYLLLAILTFKVFGLKVMH
jgi:tetrahydromethanopterin S-methyltransferase subunit G